MRKKLEKIYMALIFILLYAPIVTLVVLSFNDSKTRAKWAALPCTGTAHCLPIQRS